MEFSTEDTLTPEALDHIRTQILRVGVSDAHITIAPHPHDRFVHIITIDLQIEADRRADAQDRYRSAQAMACESSIMRPRSYGALEQV